LLRAQHYKLVQIADIGKNRKKVTLLTLLLDFIGDFKATPIGAGGQSYKVWDKSQKLLLICFTGWKIAFFR
jgi:hypothetical protein